MLDQLTNDLSTKPNVLLSSCIYYHINILIVTVPPMYRYLIIQSLINILSI